MLRLTESAFRGQVLSAHGHTEEEMLCVSKCTFVCVLVYVCVRVSAIDIEPFMWGSDRDLGPSPSGIISNSPEQSFPASVWTGNLSSLSQTCGWHQQKPKEVVRLCFSHGDVGHRVISISHEQGGSYCLSKSLGFLTRGWTLCTVQGPWKSVWVISCQSRGEQQQIGLLKLFSATEELLSACQEPDYSIQLFCSTQSVQRAPRTGPHSYLSIPDTGINSTPSDGTQKVTGRQISCRSTFGT